MIGKGLSKVLGQDKRTYLYSNSGNVQLLSGVATNLLEFQTPNAASKIEFELFIDAQLTGAGDLFTIKWFIDNQEAEGMTFKQITAADLIAPIRIHKTIRANSPVKVQIQWVPSGPVPAINASCNASGRVL